MLLELVRSALHRDLAVEEEDGAGTNAQCLGDVVVGEEDADALVVRQAT
jgi:hypothetical protein